MSVFIKNPLSKAICIALVVTFISFDLSWAYPPDHVPHDATLAVHSFFQQLSTSGQARANFLASIDNIGRYLLGDPEEGKTPLPLKYLEQVLTAELGRAIEGIDLSRVAFEDGVVLIPYARDGKRYVIQVAPINSEASKGLVGYELPISDKYAVKVAPEGYKGPAAAVKVLARNPTEPRRLIDEELAKQAQQPQAPEEGQRPSASGQSIMYIPDEEIILLTPYGLNRTHIRRILGMFDILWWAGRPQTGETKHYRQVVRKFLIAHAIGSSYGSPTTAAQAAQPKANDAELYAASRKVLEENSISIPVEVDLMLRNFRDKAATFANIDREPSLTPDQKIWLRRAYVYFVIADSIEMGADYLRRVEILRLAGREPKKDFETPKQSFEFAAGAKGDFAKFGVNAGKFMTREAIEALTDETSEMYRQLEKITAEAKKPVTLPQPQAPMEEGGRASASGRVDAKTATEIRHTLNRFNIIAGFTLNASKKKDPNMPENAAYRMGLEDIRDIFGSSEERAPYIFENQYRDKEEIDRIAREELFQAHRTTFHLKTLRDKAGEYQINLANPRIAKKLIANRRSVLYEIVEKARPMYVSCHLSAAVRWRFYGNTADNRLSFEVGMPEDKIPPEELNELSPQERADGNSVIPYRKLLEIFVRNIEELQKNLKDAGYDGPVLVESLDYHNKDDARGAYEHITDPEFILEVVGKADAGLLVDCSHLILAARNRNLGRPGYDYMEYVRQIVNEETIGRIYEVHVAVPEYGKEGEEGLDKHDLPFDTDTQAARDVKRVLAYIFELRAKMGITGKIIINFEADKNTEKSLDTLKALAQLLEKEFPEAAAARRASTSRQARDSASGKEISEAIAALKPQADKVLYIADWQDIIEREAKKAPAKVTIVLDMGDSTAYTYDINIPTTQRLTVDAQGVIKDYIAVRLYNILEAMGPARVYVEADKSVQDIVREVVGRFTPGARGKITDKQEMLPENTLTISQRLTDINRRLGRPCEFSIMLKNAANQSEVDRLKGLASEQAKVRKKQNTAQQPRKVLESAAQFSKGEVLVGIDVGGSDIKFVVVKDGRVIYRMKYDDKETWDPGKFTEAQPYLDKVRILKRLAQVIAASYGTPEYSRISQYINQIPHDKATLSQIKNAVEESENILGVEKVKASVINGMGVSFPEIVIDNKVVGIDTEKTQKIDKAEKEKLSKMADTLQKEFDFPIVMANDGDIGAFYGAVGLSQPQTLGVSLGTSVGVGFVPSSGTLEDLRTYLGRAIFDMRQKAEHNTTKVRGVVQQALPSRISLIEMARPKDASDPLNVLQAAIGFSEVYDSEKSYDKYRSAWFNSFMEIAKGEKGGKEVQEMALDIIKNSGKSLPAFLESFYDIFGAGNEIRYLVLTGAVVKEEKTREALLDGIHLSLAKYPKTAGIEIHFASDLEDRPVLKENLNLAPGLGKVDLNVYGQAIAAVWLANQRCASAHWQTRSSASGDIKTRRHNIEAMRDVLNPNKPYDGYDVIIVSSSTAEEAEVQGEMLEKAFCNIRTDNIHLNNQVLILSCVDPMEGGQVLGQLYTWLEAEKMAKEKGVPDLGRLAREGKIKVAAFHNGGRGERCSPLTQSLGNSRASQQVVGTVTGSDGTEMELTVLLGAVLQCSTFARTNDRNRIDGYWPSQIAFGIVPAEQLVRSNLPFDKFLVEFKPETAKDQDLFDFGTAALDEKGGIRAFYGNKMFAKDKAPTPTGYDRKPEELKKDLLDRGTRYAYDFGSFSMNYAMHFALLDYWKKKGFLEGRKVTKSDKRDRDPTFTEPLVTVVNAYRKGGEKAVHEAVRRFEEEETAKGEAAKQDKIAAHKEVAEFFLSNLGIFEDPTSVVGSINLGYGTQWFRYRRPIDITNDKLEALACVGGEYIEIKPAMKAGEKADRRIATEEEVQRARESLLMRGIPEGELCVFRVNGKKVTLSLEQVKAGVTVEGVYVKNSIIRNCDLAPGSEVVDSVLNNTEGKIIASASYAESSKAPEIWAVNSIVHKVADKVSVAADTQVISDAYRSGEKPPYHGRMIAHIGYDPQKGDKTTMVQEVDGEGRVYSFEDIRDITPRRKGDEEFERQIRQNTFAPRPSASGEVARVTQLFEIVEATINNTRARLVKEGNELEVFLAAGDKAPIDKAMTTVDIKRRLEEALAAAEKAGLPAGLKSAAEDIRRNLGQLEADSIVGTVIMLARKARREHQKLIVGLETDWIPGYNEKGSLQRNALSPLVQEIESLDEALRSMGLDNVIFVHKSGGELADSLLSAADRTNTRLSNVIALASNATINSESFAPLRSTDEEKGAFLAGIDPSELEKYCRSNTDSLAQLNVKIMEMLSLALELAAGKEPPNLPIILSYDKARRMVIFLPRAEPIDYQELKQIYNAHKTALQAA